MGTKRKQHSAEFKFKVALEAAKEHKTLSQLGSEYELHPTQISEWKRQLLSEGVRAFGKASAAIFRSDAARSPLSRGTESLIKYVYFLGFGGVQLSSVSITECSPPS